MSSKGRVVRGCGVWFVLMFLAAVQATYAQGSVGSFKDPVAPAPAPGYNHPGCLACGVGTRCNVTGDSTVECLCSAGYTRSTPLTCAPSKFAIRDLITNATLNATTGQACPEGSRFRRYFNASLVDQPTLVETFAECSNGTDNLYIGPTTLAIPVVAPVPAPVPAPAPAPTNSSGLPGGGGSDSNTAVIVIVVVVVVAVVLIAGAAIGYLWKRRQNQKYMAGAYAGAGKYDSGAQHIVNVKSAYPSEVSAGPPVRDPPPVTSRGLPPTSEPVAFGIEENSGFFNPEANILPTTFFANANATANAIADFCRQLMRTLKGRGLEGRLSQLRSDTVLTSTRAWRFPLESLICNVLFYQFEDDTFGASGLNLKGDRKARRDRQQLEYNRLDDQKETKGLQSYRQRCLEDLSRSLATGLQVHESDILDMLTSPELQHKFESSIRSLYQLHCAAYTFEPPVKLIFPARGTRIDPNLHDLCNARDADEQGTSYRHIAFAVFPGYRLENTILKSVVFGMEG